MMAEDDASKFGQGFVATDYVAGPLPSADTPVEDIDPSRPELFGQDLWRPIFARLRAEAPIMKVPESAYGPYWCLTTYEPIVHVSAHPEIYSSSYLNGGFNIQDMSNDPLVAIPMFIAQDDPVHAAQRKAVAPSLSPSEIRRLEEFVRRRTGELLDELPVDAEFDWVDSVSIELTTGLLAILFDFPWDERRKLTYWSDWMGDTGAALDPERREQRGKVLFEAAAYFTQLWMHRKAGGAGDMISMMARSEGFGEADQRTILGNIMLMIVGGNDTTRNAMSGAAVFMNEFPEAREELESDPSLIDTAVTETLRMMAAVTAYAAHRDGRRRSVRPSGQTGRQGRDVAYLGQSRRKRLPERRYLGSAPRKFAPPPSLSATASTAVWAPGSANFSSRSCSRRCAIGGCA